MSVCYTLTMSVARAKMARGRKRCARCKAPLFWEPGLGWVHPGGGLMVIRCEDCGWAGAPVFQPLSCPMCDSHRLHEDHAAVPK